MAYTLEAVLGPAAVIHQVAAELPAAPLITLPQGIAMLPVPEQLLNDGAGTLGFWMLPAGFADKLAAWSTAGPVGYVEAELFGGMGGQGAVLWEAQAVTFGPLTIEDEPFPSDGSPISQLLRHLGVTRGTHHDEFDAVGLGRHRHTEDWLPTT